MMRDLFWVATAMENIPAGARTLIVLDAKGKLTVELWRPPDARDAFTGSRAPQPGSNG